MAAENNGAAVTPSDAADLPVLASRLYVGTGGALVIVTAHGNTVSFSTVASGSFIDVRTRRVKATGTTASNVVALW